MSINHDNLTLNEFQKQVCIGGLLGDMSASKSTYSINYYLSCFHSQKQIQWLVQKWEWLQPFGRPIQNCNYFDKRSGKSYPGARFHTISAKCISEIASLFYIDGKKIIPNSIEDIMKHPVSLAVLICDDGSWDKAGIQIATKQFSVDGNRILGESFFKNWRIKTTIYRKGKYPSLRIPAKEVEKVRELCLGYIPAFLRYKLGGEEYQTSLIGKILKTCPVCKITFETYESEQRVFCGTKCGRKGRGSRWHKKYKQDSLPLKEGVMLYDV